MLEYVLVVFFCKQQTAYELRISDWSSDVCSSDLTNAATAQADDLADTTIREARTMQRHVDHHLARARAVGRRAIGHSRTTVCASAEAVRRAVERLYPGARFDIAGNREAEVTIERQDLDEILGDRKSTRLNSRH